MAYEETLPAAVPEESGVFSSGTTRRAARNATALALSNIASKGSLFAWQLILARWLGSSGYGTYGTIGALLAVGAAIPEFGMGMIVIRDIANRPRDAGRYLAAALAMQPLLSAVGYIALMIGAFLFGYDAELRALLAFAAVNLLVDTLGNMCHNQLLAMERMVIPAVIGTAHVLVLMMLAGIALAAGGGLWGLYTAVVIAGLLRGAAYWIALWRTGVHPAFPVDRAIMRGLLINGAPIAITSFLALAYQHADKLITTALIGTEGTGQLTAGFVIVFGVIELLSTTVLVAVFPLMSRAYGSGQRPMFDFMLEKLSLFNLTLSLPVGIYTSLLAVPLSAWLFGSDYTRTADVLRILIWYTVVTMIANVFAQGLIIQNQQRRLLAIRAGGLGVNILLNLLLLPQIGVPGAAAASLIAESGVLILMLRSYQLRADWWQRVFSRLWRLVMVGLLLAAAVWALREIHPVVAVFIGMPAYAGLLLISGAFAKDDWDLIYRLATAMPGGTVIGRYWKRTLT
ncbi:MAG: polysaccharide biosynthesis C-terminal domain-containing protein [Chloroflexi bacterium]|nr:polysaccharide biosynthesis C-terminal domain-containing protein [Chloroflexota bacterium]